MAEVHQDTQLAEKQDSELVGLIYEQVSNFEGSQRTSGLVGPLRVLFSRISQPASRVREVFTSQCATFWENNQLTTDLDKNQWAIIKTQLNDLLAVDEGK